MGYISHICYNQDARYKKVTLSICYFLRNFASNVIKGILLEKRSAAMMNNKKRNIFTFVKYLLFILIPPVFINVYYLYYTYSDNKMSDFDYNNILLPIIIRAIIICLFTVLLLEIGKRIKHIIICPLVIIIHLTLCAFFNAYPSYFMYVEVLSSLLLVAVFIPIDYIREHK